MSKNQKSKGIISYLEMQENHYNGKQCSSSMKRYNHHEHNNNPDYNGVLFSDIIENSEFWEGKNAFEFGCGCGRNMRNIGLLAKWSRIDGCDISDINLDNTIDFLNNEAVFRLPEMPDFGVHGTSGYGCGDETEDNFYDFVFSTIVLQHICVYDIRFAILKDIYRIMKPSGLLVFQMGFDGNDKVPSKIHELDKSWGGLHNNQPGGGGWRGVQGHKTKNQSSYFENKTDAKSTNSHADVSVIDPQDVIDDLKKIGFQDITFEIRPSWCDDAHYFWIYVKAKK